MKVTLLALILIVGFVAAGCGSKQDTGPKPEFGSKAAEKAGGGGKAAGDSKTGQPGGAPAPSSATAD